MDSLIKEHKDKFGVEPNIIGLYWSEPDRITINIIKAINTDKPYNEYSELTDEEKKSYDNGDLVF